MTDAAKLVLNGFLKLSSSDQNEIIDEINRYRQAGHNEKRKLEILHESVAKRVVLGPVNVGCVCCGR